MIKVETLKEYTMDYINERKIQSERYLNDTTAMIRQIVFEDMMNQTMPLKITLDETELINEIDEH